jgi:sulfoacetaldehyde dehydrogenase
MAVAVNATRSITPEEQATARLLIERARAAMAAIADYDQATVDRLCQAVAWAGGNEQTAITLANMSVDESGMGSREPKRRAKVLGILRDALRQKSMGVIEEIPEKGIVKYAKPAGVITALIPVTSPYVTPIGIAIYAIKCKDAVIFSPHPGSKNTTNETVRVMRAALRKQGIPEDLLQCVERPSIPLANELMAAADLTMATGGPAMVKAAYGSGKPAYGVGAGNATMVIDDTANVEEGGAQHAHQQDQRSRVRLLRGRQPHRRRLDLRRDVEATAARRRLSGRRAGKAAARASPTGTRRPPDADTIARPRRPLREGGLLDPDDKTFFIVEERHIGKQHRFSTKSSGRARDLQVPRLRHALDMVRQIFETGGKGHSCGIYSFDDDHIHRLALSRRSAASWCAGAVALERRHVHQRHADDLEHGLRRLGRQHHEREHLAEALHERHVGEPSDSRRQPSSRSCSASSSTAKSLCVQTRPGGCIDDRVSGHCAPQHASDDARIAAYQLTEYLERLGVEVDLRPLRPHDHRAARCARQEPHPLRLDAHEQIAAHAADGYARATGKPGVRAHPSRPGLTNAAPASPTPRSTRFRWS